MRVRLRREAAPLRQLRLNIIQQTLDAPAAHVGAEELRREVGNLVRLIEDDGVGRAQQVAEAVLLERQVGEQQMMVDDHDVGIERLSSGECDMTAGEVGTARAETVVPRRSDLRPHGIGVREPDNFGKIAAARGLRPVGEAGEHVVPSLPRRLFQTMAAQIVGTALQQGNPGGPAERRTDERQVFGVELILQRAGTGRDQHASAAKAARVRDMRKSCPCPCLPPPSGSHAGPAAAATRSAMCTC